MSETRYEVPDDVREACFVGPSGSGGPDDEVVERIAEAMYEEWWMGRLSPHKVHEPMWHESGEDCQRNYRARARRALSPKEVAGE